MTDSPQGPRLTAFGAFFTLILVGGLVGLGAWLATRPPAAPVRAPAAVTATGTAGTTSPTAATTVVDTPDPQAPKTI